MIVTFVLAIFVVIAGAYELAYYKTILPRVIVAGVELSNLNQEQAEAVLRSSFESFPNRTIVKINGSEIWNSDNLITERNFKQVAIQAYQMGRTGPIWTQWRERMSYFLKPIEIGGVLESTEPSVDAIAKAIEEEVATPGSQPKIIFESGSIKIDQGVDGLSINTPLLAAELKQKIGLPGEQVVIVNTRVVANKINEERVGLALEAANYWKGKRLLLKYGAKETTVSDKELIGLISITEEEIDEEKFDDLLDKIKPIFEQQPNNATLKIEGNRVSEFVPEREGLEIQVDQFRKLLSVNLMTSRGDTLTIPMVVTKPKVSMEEINDLGIKTLIGVGRSKFHGSIPNRIHNLSLAASRINGVIVPPGEEFSFNKSVGAIDRANGYKSAYVISAGRTVLGDGGGVCQVSTTLFRAAMNAGLPIIERKAHAYRVHYYEEDMGPGFDATVYSPSVDFRFLNDTPGHILVQSKVDPKSLSMSFELYGTSDGRIASISAARISNQSPPPETVYQDDPTLKVGALKQVDWSAWGARSEFDYTVTKNGETKRMKFVSIYRPWQAVYLRGTQP